MIIKARAPLRLGLAGGGTDVSPYCDVYGGYVLNATIDRFAYAVIKPLSTPKVVFSATDQNIQDSIVLDAVMSTNSRLALHDAVYRRIIKEFNHNVPIPLELTTFCDAPAGSGLGSSSAIVVVMVRAFMEFLNLPLDDYTIARMAFDIERVDCNLQGGRQDQYSATFGGVNFMEFYDNDRAIINPLRIKNWIICELESSLVLFYTGVSRESAKIIEAQTKSVKSGSLDAFHGTKHDALQMKECLLKGDFDGYVESMRIGWENKKALATSVSNPIIDEIYESVINAGALAGKVSGAGGGGFMMFFTPLEKRLSVISELNKFQGQVSNCHFTKNGAQAWRLP